jgi:hypothetical protein
LDTNSLLSAVLWDRTWSLYVTQPAAILQLRSVIRTTGAAALSGLQRVWQHGKL